MNNLTLGTLEQVDVKTVWPYEAKSFTPWLLENADVLAKAIGLNLELNTNEHPVGSFSLDLIGSVVGTKEVVIVENQLTPSDHSHLGQLLTYAGGTQAKYVVWIATKFREEHLAAVERLNEVSTDEVNYFCVEVSAVKIGNSAPAPLFQVVSQPNDWSKGVKASTSAGQSELAQVQLSFYTKFIEAVKSTHPTWTNASKALPQNWMTLPAGASGFWYSVSFTKSEIKSEFILGTSNATLNGARFDYLQELKDELENKLGAKLVWHFPEGNTQAIIREVRSANILDEGKWPDEIAWMINAQERLRGALAPYLKTLQNLAAENPN